MSLRTCPKCKHRVLSFGKFLIGPSSRSYECPGCKTALSLAFGHRAAASIVIGFAVLWFIRGVLFKVHLWTHEGVVPLCISVTMVFSLVLLVTGLIYLLATWRIKEGTQERQLGANDS